MNVSGKLTINTTYSEAQKHNEPFLTENGVYEVLMLSRKPVANSNNQGNGSEMVKEASKAALGEEQTLFSIFSSVLNSI